MIAIKTLTTALTYVICLCGVVPLFPWLTNGPRVFLAVGLLMGIWQDRRRNWQVKAWLQNIAIVPVFFYYAVQFSRTNPLQPVTSILAIMLAVRLSGEKTVRHSLQIYVLAMFCLASSSLFDLSPVFLVYLFLILFIVAIALVLLTFQNHKEDMAVTLRDLKRLLVSAILMPVLAVPLLLLFFPIMPRTQLPLWHFLSPPQTRSSGYSDSVEPGSKSSITESRSLAFRAEVPQQEKSKLYWRSIVFNRTDGNKWIRAAQIPSEWLETGRGLVTQIIYPEPSAMRTLVALDRPVSISLQRLRRSPDGVFEIFGTAGGRLSYSVDSQTGGMVVQRNAVNRTVYLQLPENLSPQLKAVAAIVKESSPDDRERVVYLENYFRNGKYRYSNKNLATGDNAINRFLFESKQGNCEFFASSFALLLRAAGVPCRLVGGYLGGEYNELGGYYLVSDDKAHVWVEAYLVDSGWVRIDPSSLAVNSGEVWQQASSRSLMSSINFIMDSFNHAWNRSVISYDFEQQMEIARHAGSRLDSITGLISLRSLMPYISVLLLMSGTLILFRKGKFLRSREECLLSRFFQKMDREFGIKADNNAAGLFEIARAADNVQVSEFVSVYANAVYHDRKLSVTEYNHLRKLLEIMKKTL